MNDTALAIALTGFLVLSPVAVAQPVDGGFVDAPDGALEEALALTGSHTFSATENTAETDSPNSPVENESNATDESTVTSTDSPPAAERVFPGATLAGVVSAQGAEVESEVDERAFDSRLNASGSNRSKAAVLATRQAELSERLGTLRNRSVELQRAHENGSIGESRYRAAVTALAAQATALQRQANRTDSVARDLPRAELEAAGVNVTALDRLRHSAGGLSGAETSRIAHSIAGRDVGHSVGRDRRPDHAGPPEDRGRDGRSGEDASGDRDNDDSRDDRGEDGPTDDTDRGPQNESDDRSDRGDRGRNGDAGGDASDESARGDNGEAADDGDENGDGAEGPGNGDEAGEGRSDQGDGGGAGEDRGNGDDAGEDRDDGNEAEGNRDDGDSSDRRNASGGNEDGGGSDEAEDNPDRGNGSEDRSNGNGRR
jgi:hypothetical protein